MANPEDSPWNEVLGPFYNKKTLHRRGIKSVRYLIGLTTDDGKIVYPHAQFDEIGSSKLRKRETVIEIWNMLIRPAISEGVVDEWQATRLLLQGTPEMPSAAEEMSRDPAQVSRVEEFIAGSIRQMRQ